MADLTPNNREEHWLKGMVDGSTDLTPNNRKEHWYQEIINAGGGGGGGGGGVLVVPLTYDDSGASEQMICGKTAGEILTALKQGSVVFVLEEFNQAYHCITGGVYLEGYKFVTMDMGGIEQLFYAITSDDYPTHTE